MYERRDGECCTECTESIREVAAHQCANEAKFNAEVSSSHPQTLGQFNTLIHFKVNIVTLINKKSENTNIL